MVSRLLLWFLIRLLWYLINVDHIIGYCLIYLMNKMLWFIVKLLWHLINMTVLNVAAVASHYIL